MHVRLVGSSAAPIYRQIADQVAAMIASGRLAPGDRLASVRELARALPANQNTVIKAYEYLERDGLIERRQGDGTFVAAGGNSPLRLAERRRRVSEALAQAVALGVAFELPAQTVRELLEAELGKLDRP